MFIFNALLAAGLALQPAPTAAAMPVEMPPEPSQVMVIPDELRNAFHTRVLDTTNVPEQRLRRMVDFMFAKDGLGLKYKADATNTVTESYMTRQVNCLSFTLMAVALAREAGMKAQGQQIDRVLAWGLVGDVVMQSLHANAVVTVKDRNLQVKDGRDFVLDITSNEINRPDSLINNFKVGDEHLLASFYGNRAMELLAKGRLADSKAWLDKALELNPEDAMLWSNAGVLSQRMGDVAAAESWFLQAAKQSPQLMSALYNLVALYHAKGDSTQEVYWQQRADKVLLKDPYYQFALGQQQEKSGAYVEAIDLYRRAIKINYSEPLFHFGLARAYFQLGQSRRAGSELALARDLGGEVDRSRYQAKLDALKKMLQ